MILKLLKFTLLINVVWSFLTLEGPKKQAAILNTNITFTCHILKSNSAGGPFSVVKNIHEVNEEYKIYWNFTGVGETEPRTIVTLSSNGLARPNPTWIDKSDHFRNIFDTNLHIVNVSFTHAGTYTCSIKNSVQKSAELYILEKPHCHSFNSSLRVHQKAQFDCSVNFRGNNPPQLLWKHANHNLSYSLDYTNDTYLLASMTLETEVEDDGNIFMCQVAYPGINHGYICQTAPIRVFFPVQHTNIILNPYITTHNYPAGTNINFRCISHGEPHPHYEWLFTPESDPNKNVSLSKLANYKITNVHENNNGNYTCIVHNIINGTMYNDMKHVFIQVSENKVDEGKPVYRVVSGDGLVSQPDQKEEVGDINMSPYAVGALVSAALAILLIVVFIIMAIRFRAREKRYREKMALVHDELMDDQEQELLDESSQPNSIEENHGQYERMRQYWEIPRRDVRLMDIIATGSYSEVWRGRMRKHSDSTDVLRVAIKKIMDDAPEVGRRFFLAEMEVMKMLKSHSNVICLIGCYTINEPWLLMLEYAHEGSVQTFLQKNRPGVQHVEFHGLSPESNSSSSSVSLKNNKVDAHKLLSMASQIVIGLQHISKYKLIYYRLSASSVLVAKGGVCKLSGFGFQSDITERNNYERESLPIRCMAPESLTNNVYDTKTDIWSYGILLWQMVHFGSRPYNEMELEEVREQVISGYHMPKPQHCSPELYGLMEKCWNTSPDSRPIYPDILKTLSVLDINSDSHINIQNLPSLSYDSDQETENL